jgi:hypothetical protein
MLQYAGRHHRRLGEGNVMRIERPHTLGRQEAIGRVDRVLDRLIQEPPGGVTIRDPRKTWDGNRMTFSFGIAKGFFTTSFRGSMDVMDDRVVVESELPPLVRTFLGEERIGQVILEHLGHVLK